MEYRPSKFALFLTRLMNYISGFSFVWGVTSLCNYLLSVWISLPITIIGWGIFGASVYATNLVPFLKLISKWICQRRIYSDDPSYWQIQWMKRARTFGYKPGHEWHPSIIALGTFVICTSIMAIQYRLMPEMGYWSWNIFPANALSSCFAGMFTFIFGCTGFGLKPKQGPDNDWLPYDFDPNDPDDFGPAGKGARLRRPTPVLDATERKRA